MPGNGKYTEELANQIADLVAGGTPAKWAAQACGIHEITFYKWLQEHPNFANIVQSKRADALNERIERIRQAGKKGNWTADAWYLERQHPEEFGVKPERRDINITVEIRDCTADAGQVEQRPEPKCIPYIDVDVDK